MYTEIQQRAINLLALAGKVRPAKSPRVHLNEVAVVTGNWLERQGFAQRMYTGDDQGLLVITDVGRVAADELLAADESSGD